MRNLTPIQWAVIPLKKFAVFRGRASRSEYWWFYLMTTIIGFLATGADYAIGFSDTGPVNSATSIAFMVPWISVTVRRLHDTDRSGWWLGGGLLAIIVLAAFAIAGELNFDDPPIPMILAFAACAIWFVALFIFSVLPGTEGGNRYGPDPHNERDLENVFA